MNRCDSNCGGICGLVFYDFLSHWRHTSMDTYAYWHPSNQENISQKLTTQRWIIRDAFPFRHCGSVLGSCHWGNQGKNTIFCSLLICPEACLPPKGKKSQLGGNKLPKYNLSRNTCLCSFLTSFYKWYNWNLSIHILPPFSLLNYLRISLHKMLSSPNGQSALITGVFTEFKHLPQSARCS